MMSIDPRRLWWLLLLPLTVQAEPLSLSALMQRFAQVEERTASYTETQYLSMLDVPLESRGTLHFRAPDLLEKRVANGGGSYRVEGRQLEVEQGGQLRRLGLDGYPALAAFVASFRATLAGDLNTLRRYYQTSLEGDLHAWTLTLEPTQDEMARVIRRISIHGSGARVIRIDMLEQGGDRTRMELRESDEG